MALPSQPCKDEPSAQLYATLRDSIIDAFSTRRPLLTHLNADTTWLLSVPYPADAPNPKNRRFYHILLDPWLKGGQSDVATFFSQQWHKQPSAVQTIADVDNAIQGIEQVAHGPILRDDEDMQFAGAYNLVTHDSPDKSSASWVDMVVISHEFTDHMHKETLLEVSSQTPVLATFKAASIIRSWRHFSQVHDILAFSGNWFESSKDPLPSWIGISRLAYLGRDLLYYHSAIMVAFSLNGVYSRPEAEAVIYTPHGVAPRDVEILATASPSISTLALLHGLHDIALPAKAQLNLGAHNGLRIQRILDAKYWIATHDEIKIGGGLVSWFLNRQIITMQQALQSEEKEYVHKVRLDISREPTFVDLGNGESLILE
ncbi:hypothetical protein B0O99DRAFT_592760 [Bisporella sp. PMI_857]|nr:hypothetical protein B0O99DRAFT_592760 [Bisporella sp. PMI_857]